MKRKSATACAVLLAALLAGNASAQPNDEGYLNDRYCMTCHGADGMGSEGISAPRLAGMEPWYLQRQLEMFRAGVRGTHESDLQGREMQPMAAKLSDDSIADLVAWVGSWAYKPVQPTLTGDVAAGQALYGSCASCHGADGSGNASLGAPALAGQNDWYLVTQLKNFKAGFRGTHPQDTYGAQMTAMAAMLADQAAIENVVSYINTLGR